MPASAADYELKDLRLRIGELNGFEADADQPLMVNTNIASNLGQLLAIRITPGTDATWQKPFSESKEKAPQATTTEWYVTNTNTSPAKLHVRTYTDIEMPEVRVVPLAAVALVALVGGLPGIAAAHAQGVRHRPDHGQRGHVAAAVLPGAGHRSCGLLAFIFVPYNTFGEDIKMLKDSGLIWIMVWGIIVAVWAASVSISEEVEGRTALTVLSKPVQAAAVHPGQVPGRARPGGRAVRGAGACCSCSPSRTRSCTTPARVAKTEPPWQLCYLEMIRIVPGLVLAFLETVVLAAISVAISTRLPMLANLIICSSIYVLGHLVPMIVNSSVGKFEIVRFVGQFIATVLPVLDHFNIQAAVAAGAARAARATWAWRCSTACSTPPSPCCWAWRCSKTATWRNDSRRLSVHEQRRHAGQPRLRGEQNGVACTRRQ